MSLLKLENFDHKLFKVRTQKNFDDMSKVKVMEVHSSYLTDLKDFIAKTMSYLEEHSKEFETERANLLKDANLLHKEKNKNSYSKDKHKNHKFNDGY